MKVFFGQVYVQPNVFFPFSHHFQRRLSREVSSAVSPSESFSAKYPDFELMFNISAKKRLKDTDIRGPTVFRRARDIEYTIFLPFDVIMKRVDPPNVALEFLLDSVCQVLEQLELDYTALLDKRSSLIKAICTDPSMLDHPSWNEAENQLHVRRVFSEFFLGK